MEKALKKKPIYVVFDIGKANKKLLLFDEDRQILCEHLHVCIDAYDEDNHACDHIQRLALWVQSHWENLLANPQYAIKGVNFAAYSAAWVHLDAEGQAFMPLYSYLKPLPVAITAQFYAELGQSPEEFALATRAPQLGMQNAGLQLYWLKYAQPAQYARIHTSLHLPHYLSYLITGERYSDYSTVGCHTGLWDFDRQDYHAWVYREGLVDKLAPLIRDSVATVLDGVLVGVGMHDSVAALATYLVENQEEEFVLVSTGTWCVTFNPFNKQKLSPELLCQGCVNYLSPRGEAVLAARLPLGQEHDYQVARIARYFNIPPDFYQALQNVNPAEQPADTLPPIWADLLVLAEPSATTEWALTPFASATAAYQHLLFALVHRLRTAIDLVRQSENTIFVDGGFARNLLFMQYLSRHYPNVQIRTPVVPQATAIGALIHLEQGEARKKTQPLFAK